MFCVLSGCGGEQVQNGTLAFFVCSPWPGLNTGWDPGRIWGCLWHLQMLVAAGAGSGTPRRPLPSSAAVVVLGLGCGAGRAGVGLSSSSPAQAPVQNRGAEQLIYETKAEGEVGATGSVSEQALPCVFRLCFKQKVFFKKRPVVTNRTERCCKCISSPKDARGRMRKG